MSAWGLLQEGHPIDALMRAFDWLINKMPPPLAAIIKKFATDEGAVILGVAATLATDVLMNGKSIQSAGDEAVATLAVQGLAVAKNDAMDAIRLSMSGQTPLTVTPVVS